MKDKNLESALREVREALLNFGAAAQNVYVDDMEGWKAQRAFEDMAAWFNYYVDHNDVAIERLDYVEPDREISDNEVVREHENATN